MKNFFVFLLLGIFLFFDLKSQWEPCNNGFTNQIVSSITSYSNVVYLTARKLGSEFGSLYSYSFDSGNNSWVRKDLQNLSKPNCVKVLGNTVYVCGKNGINYSTDGGATWQKPATNLSNIEFYTIATDGNTIFAGSNSGVFFSSNNGSTWLPFNYGLTNNFVQSLIYEDGIVYAGTKNGIFVTTDLGITWEARNNGISSLTVNAICVFEGKILIGTDKQGIFVSTNKGLSWEAKNTGINDSTVNCFLVIDNQIWAGTNQGIYFSNDGGENWTMLSKLENFYGFLTLHYFNDRIFAGTYGGVLVSYDFGRSWQPFTVGLPYPRLTFLYTEGTRFYAGGVGGEGNQCDLFLFDENNNQWLLKKIPRGNYSLQGIGEPNTMLIKDSMIFVGTTGRYVCELFRSTDNGATWERIPQPDCQFSIKKLFKKGNLLFALTDRNLSVSTNNGDSWKAIDLGLDGKVHYEAIAYDENKIFVAVLLWKGTATEKVVLLSTNDGETWLKKSLCSENLLPQCMLIDGDKIYAGTTNGVFISTDNGETWFWQSNGIEGKSVASIYKSENALFALTNEDIFVSLNNGTSWNAANTGGLPKTNYPENRMIAIHNDYVYVGNWGEESGIFRIKFMDIISNLLGGFNPSVNPNTIEIYPNPASNYLKISGLKKSIKGELRLSNNLGELILEKKVEELTDIQLNISYLPTGVYFLTIVAGGETITKPFVVIK